MAENKNNIITKFSNNKLYVFYSFFIASILMFLYYVVGGMVFGNYVVMRSDLISGIIGGIKESMRNIINGDNIWFSFSTCLGMDNALSVSSCLFSPFNILYLIFYKLDLPYL